MNQRINWSNPSQVQMIFNLATDLLRASFSNPSCRPEQLGQDELERLSHTCLHGAEAMLIALYAREQQEPDDADLPTEH